MKVISVFNALAALDALDLLDHIHIETNWKQKKIKGATKQQLKLAIALSDTGYSAMFMACENIDTYRKSGKKLSEFYALLVQPEGPNPLDVAMGMICEV